MSRTIVVRRSSPILGLLAGGFMFLLIVGILIKVFPYLLAVIALVVAYKLARWAVRVHRRRSAAEKARKAALVARADRQHAQVLNGDVRGVYGQYPPHI